MKIFARIFVSFSLATVLAIAVSGAFLLTHRPNRNAELSRSIPVGELQACTLRASRALATGRAAYDSAPICKAEYLIAPNDRDLFSRPVPTAVMRLAERARREQDVELASVPGDTVAVFPVHGESGEPIVVVYDMPLPGRPPISPLWLQLVPFAFAAAIICYVLTGYIVKPLQRLGSTADDLGRGDLSARTGAVLSDRRDEFGDLARTFDRMADRIESLVLNQKMFLAHVSHELGSPLTRLNMGLALARRRASPDLITDLDRIGKESQELNNLVQQLLLFARLESGNELDAKLETFFVSSVLRDVVGDAQFEAQQTGRTLRLTGGEDFCVKGHCELLKRAVENVVRNALRFTPQGGVVDMEYLVDADKNKGLINIRDEGPGVAPQELNKIFEPFATSGASGGHSGVGLGLAIARQAVVVHRGEIQAQNVTGGLLVTIKLPIAASFPNALSGQALNSTDSRQ